MANSKISALTSATTPLAGTETLPVVQSGATKQVSVANLTAGRTVAGGAYTIGTDQHLLYDIDASTIGIRIGTSGPYYNIKTTSGNSLQLNNASGGDVLLAIAGTTCLTVANTTGNVTFNTGNLIQGTAAKGINFTANTGAAGMTSQLLNWYEEGTFTPTIEGSSTAGTASYTVQTGAYTRVGRVVHFQIYLVWASGTGTGDLYVGGLPFTSASNASAYGGAFAPVLLNVALTANNFATGAYILSSNTKMRFYQTPVGGGAATAVPYDGAGECMLIGSYFV